MQIETKIKDLIKKSGPISLSRYMEICLWDDENGYYASNQVLGKNGDFITSPDISIGSLNTPPSYSSGSVS